VGKCQGIIVEHIFTTLAQINLSGDGAGLGKKSLQRLGRAFRKETHIVQQSSAGIGSGEGKNKGEWVVQERLI